jgi:hypothetical protein
MNILKKFLLSLVMISLFILSGIAMLVVGFSFMLLDSYFYCQEWLYKDDEKFYWDRKL